MTTHPSTPSTPSPSPWQPVGEIIRFELQESLRNRFVLIAFGVFFAYGLLVMHVNGTDWRFSELLRQAIGTATKPGELIPYANSPLAIMKTIGFIAGIPLALVVSGIFADRATKDFAANIDGLLFTSPLKEWQFAAGRLIASFVISGVIFLGVGLGLLVGQALPWMDPNRIAPFNLLSYIQPYLYFVIPNILIFGLFSFALGLLTRRTLTSYLAIVGLDVASGIVAALFTVLKFDPLWNVLVQPLTSSSIEYTVRFWTRVQQNTDMVPFAPVIWLSRLLYLGLSIAFFAWVWRRFSFSGIATAPPNPRLERLLDWGEQRLMFWRAKATKGELAATANHRGEVSLPPPSVHLYYGNGAQWGHVWRIAQLEFKRLCWNPLVMSILALSLVMLVALTSTSLQDGTGAKILPITGMMIQLMALLAKLLAPLLLIFLAGDLVWRDRDVKIDPLSDPLPVRSWVLVLGKLLALALILGLVMVLMLLGGLISQTVQQYTHYELGVYAIELFTLVFVDLLLIAVLAITIQVLVNQKFLGYVLSAFLIIVFSQGVSLFKSFRLLQYGYRPEHYYSQINGYGGMLRQVRWFQGYWLAIALLLLGVATLFWVRGIDTQPQARWRIARQRFTRPMQMGMGLSAIAALFLGGLIYYNTHLLNSAPSRAQMETQVVAYEKAYGSLIDAQPKIAAIDLQGDLYPEEDGRFAVTGTYTLENRTQQPINKILLNVPQGVQVNQLTVNGAAAQTTVPHPVVQGFEFALPAALQPGNRLDVAFDLLMPPPKGFTGEKPSNLNNSYDQNGLFFRSPEVLPMVGFFDRPRIKDDQRRAAAGLPPLDPAVEADRQIRRSATAAAPDADLVQFSATLSTAADQIAITAGEPVKQWTEGDRRYFQYQTQVPIEQVVPILSGRYELLRDQWQDVQLEMYYHPGHDRNLERMVRGTQKALAYASQHFGPFPHQTLRTVEVPHQTLAMSFPTTIIRGERFGYLAKFNDDDPTSVDEAFRVAAHETAHQWWGQQLIPSATPGARFLLEALPEYTANQVYAKEHGLEKLGAALRSNLDNYLQDRDKSDVPLVEAEESHLVYKKGALALFALQDYIGEDVVNKALANLLRQFSDVPPYPSAKDLVAALREVTPAKYQYLITDLFETVTLYDNSTESATVQPRPDGKFDVKLTVNAAKLRSDGVGNETPTDINNEEIDIGIYSAAGKLIYLRKHPIRTGDTELTITVDQQPTRAGIDPLHKLIDKVPNDNLVNVNPVNVN